jgi:chromosomal replication initiation ATPase DnaA
MTRKEAIKRIEEITGHKYVNLQYYKLSELLKELEQVKIVYRDKILYSDANLTKYVDYDAEAEEIIKLYDITLDELKSRKRFEKYVAARAHYCRYMKVKYKYVTSVGLARYLNKDHSTVLHYLHNYKGGCPIESLPVNQYVND